MSYMVLRNGKRKYNETPTNKKINEKAFEGITIYDPKYFECGTKPFNSIELKCLHKTYCCQRSQSRFRDSLRGGQWVELQSKKCALFYSVGHQDLIELISNCFNQQPFDDLSNIKVNKEYRLLILLRMLKSYWTFGIFHKTIPWRSSDIVIDISND